MALAGTKDWGTGRAKFGVPKRVKKAVAKLSGIVAASRSSMDWGSCVWFAWSDELEARIEETHLRDAEAGDKCILLSSLVHCVRDVIGSNLGDVRI